MRKEPTREMKINRIITHIEDMADVIEEDYLDDLVSIVQQYHAVATADRKHKLK